MVLDSFVRNHSLTWGQKNYKGWIAHGAVYGNDLLCLKPLTFMNRSGESVAAMVTALSLDPCDLLVVHDDIDLSFGRIRIRRGGSSGGHKGVQSIIDALGTSDFMRMRVGIGRPVAGDIESWVLEPFSAQEAEVLPEVLDRALAAIDCILAQGITEAMNRFNIRDRLLS